MGAHPRSRGENDLRLIAGMGPQGSSPLTRGKLRRGIRRFKKERLIPAHAGKTARLQCKTCARPAHPRSRRENKQLLVAAASQRGSSPLTRGKRDHRRYRDRSPGLIPAHAGKTLEWS